jgi:hypothetical protein
MIPISLQDTPFLLNGIEFAETSLALGTTVIGTMVTPIVQRVT